jgi:hypothetical protein
MKLKPLLELVAFLGAELLASSLGMLSIDTCTPRPLPNEKPGVATPTSVVPEGRKPVLGSLFKTPFFGSPGKETPVPPSPAQIMAAA